MMQTQRVRFNYGGVYGNIALTDDSKKVGRKFRKNCDSCGLIKNTYTGDVYQFSFYCQECCDNKSSWGKCTSCSCEDILKNEKCLICWNTEKTKTLSKKVIAKCMGSCSVCKFKNEYLVNVYGLGLCMQCCNNIQKCNMCKLLKLTVKGYCITCTNEIDEAMKTNHYYPLMARSEN